MPCTVCSVSFPVRTVTETFETPDTSMRVATVVKGMDRHR